MAGLSGQLDGRRSVVAWFIGFFPINPISQVSCVGQRHLSKTAKRNTPKKWRRIKGLCAPKSSEEFRCKIRGNLVARIEDGERAASSNRLWRRSYIILMLVQIRSRIG